MKLTGKVALITNVSHFMGPAITEEFCREGASVALHDRDAAAAKPFAVIAERLGRDVLLLSGDLSRSREADAAVDAVVTRFGRLDILVNNNAHPPSGCPAEQITDEAWREMQARLLDEPFFCLRAALRVMRPAGRGKIINMSSAAAFPGLPNYAAYTAARAGVNGLTKAVGREVARDGIQVNAIAQNYVENPTYFPPALTADPVKLARMVRNIPAGRLARSEESARLAVYLASEDADFFVGQVIPFSGGWVTP
ncbi:MAG TPA: SDR family oxidoreductase [Candidatus Nitrosotalea sp.]|jgi:NAD(P)-dependent dehydrogenase (short-subunit alcohol dehydrogenase family)|nr:SDR family oxidoreductase [Candidatus Nitrosotalea sp.]